MLVQRITANVLLVQRGINQETVLWLAKYVLSVNINQVTLMESVMFVILECMLMLLPARHVNHVHRDMCNLYHHKVCVIHAYWGIIKKI